jgi:hypothetical protein
LPVDGEPIELRCLIALRDARAAFFNEIVAHAQSHCENPLSPDDVATLRGEEVFQIAEFYYLVDRYSLGEPIRIRSFLHRHNEDISELLSDKDKRAAQGLTTSRLQDCRFSEMQIEKVAHEISEGKLRLDQTDLGSLLSPCMSPETTRKAVIALGKGSLLRRIKIAGRVLLVSGGVLEGYFEKHLRAVVTSVEAALLEGDKHETQVRSNRRIRRAS